MYNRDTCYQTLEQLHERRKQVVRLHRKGHGVMHIVEFTGLSYPAVRRRLGFLSPAVFRQEYLAKQLAA